jgi:benzoate/toluate 1,2-dioxygenase beta subunit
VSELAGAELLREVERFVYAEARLADEHEYERWEALWTDDALYWLPYGADDADPEQRMSVIYDNRARIGTRVRQLLTGKRHAATPPPRVRRLITNLELLGEQDGDVLAGANFAAYESRERGVHVWAGRVEYRLRPTPDGLRMAAKKVFLIDNDRPLRTLSFLI